MGAGVGMMRDRRRSGWVLDGCLWMKAERGGDWKIFKAYRAALANLGHVCGVLGSPLLCSRWWGRRVSLFRDFECCKLDLFDATRRSALPVAASGELVRARVLISGACDAAINSLHFFTFGCLLHFLGNLKRSVLSFRWHSN